MRIPTPHHHSPLVDSFTPLKVCHGDQLHLPGLTCVSGERGGGDDGLVLVELRALPHVVLEGALGLVAVQGAGVVLRFEAVVGGHPLQAAEGRLAAPGVGEPVTALQAVDALEGVLAAQLACGRSAEGVRQSGEENGSAAVLTKVALQD